jgi:hypothetical protein
MPRSCPREGFVVGKVFLEKESPVSKLEKKSRSFCVNTSEQVKINYVIDAHFQQSSLLKHAPSSQMLGLTIAVFNYPFKE